MSDIYDYSPDESLEYFDYDADRQGFSFPCIGSLSPIQLAQAPAPPLPLLLSPLEQLAEVAAAASLELVAPAAPPVENTLASPELVWPSPPTIMYSAWSSVEPTSTPSSPHFGPSRSPSPINYENIPTLPGITCEELTT